MKVNAQAFAHLMRLLLENQWTAKQLAEHTGLNENTINDYIKALAKKRVVHVAGWAHDPRGCPTAREWMIGDKPNKPRPKPVPGNVRAREWQRRKRLQLKLATQQGNAMAQMAVVIERAARKDTEKI